MVQLPVPYRSQWDSDADSHSADCGPTSLVMILGYYNIPMTPNQVYNHIAPRKSGEYTKAWELMNVAKLRGVKLSWRAYANRTAALDNLRANLDAGNPFIALIKYQPWRRLTGNQFDFGHFIVVTGYDDNHIYFHDPLFGMWVQRERGAHFPLSYDDFTRGWGGFPAAENPNWGCLIPGNVVDAGKPAPPPQPSPPQPPPTPPQPPKPQPEPQPPAPEPPAPQPPVPQPPPSRPGGRAMDDVNLRIRALAAYRHAEPPDFNNPTELQLWLDHLGDWGAEYDPYQVRPGDTLSGLSGRFYGQQSRWPAIQVYNNLNREGLWADERLRIPRLGQSGAHLDPALPRDTLDLSKALELEMLFDPDEPAQDYNSLVGPSTFGVGFFDPAQLDQ